MRWQFKVLCDDGHEHEVTKETDVQMREVRPGLAGGKTISTYKLTKTGEVLKEINQRTFKSETSGKVFSKQVA